MTQILSNPNRQTAARTPPPPVTHAVHSTRIIRQSVQKILKTTPWLTRVSRQASGGGISLRRTSHYARRDEWISLRLRGRGGGGRRGRWEWNRRRSPANRMDDERHNQRYFFSSSPSFFFSPPPPATHWQRRQGEEEIGRAGVARHRARRDEDRAGEK